MKACAPKESLPCVIAFAVGKKDSGYCNEAKDLDCECYAKVSISRNEPIVLPPEPDDGAPYVQKSCRNEFAIYRDSIDYCQGNAGCITAFAKSKNDLKICSRIEDRDAEQLCVFSFGLEKTDKAACNFLEDSENQALCLRMTESQIDSVLMNQAANTNSPKVCGDVSIKNRAQCYFNVGMSLGEFFHYVEYRNFWLKYFVFLGSYLLLFIVPLLIFLRHIIKHDFEGGGLGYLVLLLFPLVISGEGIFELAKRYFVFADQVFDERLIRAALAICAWGISIFLYTLHKKGRFLRMVQIVLTIGVGVFMLIPPLYLFTYLYIFPFLSLLQN